MLTAVETPLRRQRIAVMAVFREPADGLRAVSVAQARLAADEADQAAPQEGVIDADRQRQPERAGQPAHPKQDREGHRGKQLGAAADRNRPEQRADDQPAKHRHRCQEQRRLAERPEQRRDRVLATPCKGRHQGQQRDNREVLKQQNRKCQAAAAGCQFAALGQKLQHDRGRGKGEPAADNNRRFEGKPGPPGDEGDDQRRYADLRGADPEYLVADKFQPLDTELQTDGEKQENDAKLGNIVNLPGLGDQTEHPGADDNARDQIPEHQTRPEMLKHRRNGYRGDQKYQGFA